MTSNLITIDGHTCFRPQNHPLIHHGTFCPKCGSKAISLPTVATDTFDCQECGNRFPMNDEDRDLMRASDESDYDKAYGS